MTHNDDLWFDEPMRWAQLVLVEDDPGHVDIDFWLDYFTRVHADGACLSAGGYVAYYPTEIPLHHRSSWLGDRDPFGALVQGCRDRDMYVLARTDPHAVHQDVYEAHPDWIAVDAEGNPRHHWSTPEAWVTCALGPYNEVFMTQVHEEIVALYGVDGIFSNRWAGHGICYCEHCQRNFRAASGMALPRTQDPQDPRWRAYLQWREDRLFEICRIWDGAMRAVNPRARYIPNSGGGALSTLDMKRLGELVPFLFADRQGRRGVMAPWANGKNGKEFRAAFGPKPIGGIFSVGLEEQHRWKDAVQSEAELRTWVADGIANGMRPWFIKFSGVLYDLRWLEVVEDLFRWHHDVELYLRNEAPLARVAVVYSQQTAACYGGQEARQKVEDPILGIYQALIEARIPFEMVHDKLLDSAYVDRFKTLILPNVAALSDAQCQQLRDFVGRGGSLIATQETSLYNEGGERREDFGLADLFGVRCTGEVQGPIKNTYIHLDPDAPAADIWLRGLENTTRIIGGIYRVPVEAGIDFPPQPLTFIPPYPDLPMEEVYPRWARTNIPEVYAREIGAGRVVYFPWDIARVFWEVLNADHAVLLRNAVQWAMGDEDPPVTVSGPGVLDVTVWRQRASLTVHLVNLTNPMMMKGPMRELISLAAQRVRIRLPEGQRATRVHLLKANHTLPFEQRAGHVTAIVPSVLDHEVVAVDLEEA